jgi:ferrous-iron efflux pump FieF
MSQAILQQQEKAVFWGLVLALVACVPAVAVALRSGSMLLLSDLPDYARSIFTGFVGWRILRSIRLGRLQGFDYGTEKIQTLGGIVGSITYVAALLALAGLSISRFVHPEPVDETFAAIGAALQFAEFLVMGWLWRRTKMLARLEHSGIMEMQWRANRADALAALVVFAALMMTLGLREYAWSVYVDPLLALVFVCYAVVSFIPLLAAGVNDILDKTLQEDLQLQIDRRLAENFDGYAGFHGVRSRRTGGKVLVEIALSFSPEQQVRDAARTASRLCQGIQADIAGCEVRVVLMPCDTP